MVYLALVPAGNRLTALISSWRSSSFQPFPPPLLPPPPLACSAPRAACLAWTSASFSFWSCTLTSWTWREEEQQQQDVCEKHESPCGPELGFAASYLLDHHCLALVFRGHHQDFIQRLQTANDQIVCKKFVYPWTWIAIFRGNWKKYGDQLEIWPLFARPKYPESRWRRVIIFDKLFLTLTVAGEQQIKTKYF